MSASESAFSDAEEELSRSAAGLITGDGSRQQSVDAMFRVKHGKRKRVVSPKHDEKVSKSQRSDMLGEIKRQIDASIKEAMQELSEKIFTKLASVESKVEKLEGQLFERDQRIDDLTSKCTAYDERIKELEGQIEELECHSRASNLVLWSEQIGKRREGENIEDIIIRVINENFPNKSVSKSDFTAIHRLPRENTAICAFVSRSLRNELYEARFELRRREVTAKGRLFLSESLTKKNREIFNKLLDLKRRNQIWTAFTRNGIPCVKISKDSSYIRVHTLDQLQLLPRSPSPAAAPPGDRRSGGGGGGGGGAAAVGPPGRPAGGRREPGAAGPLPGGRRQDGGPSPLRVPADVSSAGPSSSSAAVSPAAHGAPSDVSAPDRSRDAPSRKPSAGAPG